MRARTTGLRGRRRGWVGTEGTGSCFFYARRGPGDAVTVSSSAPLLPCWILHFAPYNWQLLLRRYRYLPATFTSLRPLPYTTFRTSSTPASIPPPIASPIPIRRIRTTPFPSVVLRPLPGNSLHISRPAGFYLFSHPIFLFSTTISPLLSSGIFLFFLRHFVLACGFSFYTPFFCALSWGGGGDRWVCVALGVWSVEMWGGWGEWRVEECTGVGRGGESGGWRV